MSTIREILPLTTCQVGKVKWFEVRIKFENDETKRWDMSLQQLKKLGCSVTRLSETKKLKDWILSDGKNFFENQVNTNKE